MACLLADAAVTSTGCHGTMPVKPETDICMVSAADPTPAEPAPFQGCICSVPDGSSVYFLTFKQCDKFVAIHPEQFQALGDYIIAVEQAAQKACKIDGSTALDAVIGFQDRYQSLIKTRQSGTGL